VLIADFQNGTGDPAFDRTLEPMLKLALEGSGFINAYDRNGITRSLGVRPPAKLDDVTAQQIAAKQGVGVVVAGSLARSGGTYEVLVRAIETVTGKPITTAQARTGDKQQVLAVANGLAARVRRALGDNTSDTARRFATETVSAGSLDALHAYA